METSVWRLREHFTFGRADAGFSVQADEHQEPEGLLRGILQRINRSDRMSPHRKI
jgi:hypothetical protein